MRDQTLNYFDTPEPVLMDTPRYYGDVDIAASPPWPTLDPHKMHTTLNRMQQQINTLTANVETLQFTSQRLKGVIGDAVKDLYEFADFVAQNPGMGLDDWLNVVKVKDVINRALRDTTDDTNDAVQIGVGTMGNVSGSATPAYSINRGVSY